MHRFEIRGVPAICLTTTQTFICIYFAGPRAAEAHLGTAGCHVGFLNFPRRRGCLRLHRRSLRSYFTMTSTIASILKQKPRNSSCVSMAVSIKNRQLLALTAQGSADRRGSTWPHTRRVMRLRAKTLGSRCFRRKKEMKKKKPFATDESAPREFFLVHTFASHQDAVPLIRRQKSPPVRDPGSPGSVTSRSVPPPLPCITGFY